MSLPFRYLQQKAFEDLSEEDRRTLQDRFEGDRLYSYQAALKGEVRFILSSFILDYVLCFLGFKTEMQCF